jgi:flagellar hook-associated protein 3 FlgL
MRVTDRMIFDRGAIDAAAARSRAEDAVNVASTGLKLRHPGDAPADAGLVVLNDGQAARATAIGAGAAAASDELGAVDTALGDVANQLARAREIAMQFGSAGFTAQQRADASAEVQGLVKGIISSLNTQVSGRYVLGGTLDGSPPFVAAGNSGTYVGDAGVRNVEVAPGVVQQANVRADLAFTTAGGGVDVLATLGQLVTDLQANSQSGVAGALTSLDAATTQVSAARQQTGTSMAILDNAVSINRAVHDEAVVRSSHLTDADPVDANTQLALAQRALEASLTATSESFKFTLLNYLK